jgi:glycosyltransferase involved in cell wall biosynthesis
MSRRLHIVVLPEWYPSAEHPVAGVFVRDQARAVAADHDLTVLVHGSGAPGGRIASVTTQMEYGLPTARVRTVRPLETTAGRVAFVAGATRFLARLRREGRPADLLHAHVYSGGIMAQLLSRGRLPIVLSEHHSDFIEGKVRGYDAWLARRALRGADLVCPVSPLLEQHLRALEPRACCEVVPNVVDVDAFAAPRAGRVREPGPLRLIVVALLSRQKGIEYLLDAMAEIRNVRPDATLDIVGDGPDRADLEAMAASLPPGAVSFHGLQPRERVAELMHASDVFVLPSVVESFGVVLVEALAAGLPVVTTHEVGLAGAIGERFGAFVAARDPVALAKAVIEVADRLGRFPVEEARRHAQSYGAAVVARRWDDIYARLTGPA